jgi:hypothetical protein
MHPTRTILCVPLLCAAIMLAGWSRVPALAEPPLPSPDLELTILSARALSGTAGDFVTVQGSVANTGTQSIESIATYLSLVDTEQNLPVDLEDWSAERGLFVGTIAPGQVFPLIWKIHLVKAGTYNLVIIANRADRDRPEVSTQTTLLVKPKRNLNPGQVLPVALGMPLLLGFALALLAYLRRRRIDH